MERYWIMIKTACFYKKAVQLLKEQGHEVAIATGRAPFMFKDLREELDIQTYISFNGQYIVLNGEVLYKTR